MTDEYGREIIEKSANFMGDFIRVTFNRSPNVTTDLFGWYTPNPIVTWNSDIPLTIDAANRLHGVKELEPNRVIKIKGDEEEVMIYCDPWFDFEYFDLMHIKELHYNKTKSNISWEEFVTIIRTLCSDSSAMHSYINSLPQFQNLPNIN